MKIILEILGLFVSVAACIFAFGYLDGWESIIAKWRKWNADRNFKAAIRAWVNSSPDPPQPSCSWWARHQRDRRKRERRVANLQARVNQGRRLMERYPIPTEAEALEMLDGLEADEPTPEAKHPLDGKPYDIARVTYLDPGPQMWN